MRMLTDDAVHAMSGIRRPRRLMKGAGEPLRAWLIAAGYTENVDFFKRVDGWYSVADPRDRAAIEQPRARVRPPLRRQA